jgi:glycosyltransferase involved in cell wall biosynthesis
VSFAPRISVLISTFNNARFVPKKLTEIQQQTIFNEAEFLFLETGSPERERDLLAPFCGQHENCRTITTDDRRTLYQAWNLGWREAKAPIVCYSNMDDAMHPRLLERVTQAMDRDDADAGTVLIAKQPLDSQWNDWSPRRLRTLPLSTRAGPFTAWRNALRERLGDFDERFAAAADKEFWHRITKLGLRVVLVPEILYLYTRNPESLSVGVRKSDRWKEEQALAAEMDLTWPASLARQVRLARLRRYIQRSYGIVRTDR